MDRTGLAVFYVVGLSIALSALPVASCAAQSGASIVELNYAPYSRALLNQAVLWDSDDSTPTPRNGTINDPSSPSVSWLGLSGRTIRAFAGVNSNVANFGAHASFTMSAQHYYPGSTIYPTLPRGNYTLRVNGVELTNHAFAGAFSQRQQFPGYPAVTITVTGTASAVGSNASGAVWVDVSGPCGLALPPYQVSVQVEVGLESSAWAFLYGPRSGVCMSRGESQLNPALPSSGGSQPGFCSATSGQWFDPPLALGYDFQQTGTSLFTDILSLPVGIDGDGLFEVLVGTQSLGQFAQGSRVNFVQLLGQGVPAFRIAGIDPAKDATDVEAFPVQLAFDTPTADFTMTPVTWRSVGTSCVELGTCPACSPVTLSPTGDALLGNATFGLQLQNAPAGGFSLFAISVGHPVLQPLFCGSIALSVPFVEIGSSFNPGAGPCGSTVPMGLPIPNDPYLFGFFVTAQAGFLCPAGGLGLSNAIEFPIGS